MRGWTLESRVRYASVWTAVNFASLVAIMALNGSLSLPLLLVIPVVSVSFVLQGWVAYPLAKRRLGGL